MLAKETESKVIQLLFEICKCLNEIENCKQYTTANILIDPSQIFFNIDINRLSKIIPEDLQSFIKYGYQLNIYSQDGTQCNLNDVKNLIYFYDKDFDGSLNYNEFLNLLFSDSNHSIKKISKKQFNSSGLKYDLPNDIRYLVVNAFWKEIKYNQSIIELIRDIKGQHDFSIQDLYYSLKSYSFITPESIRAFFDRNDVSCNEEDIRLMITRINIKKDGKICFNEFKGLFDLTFGKNDEEISSYLSYSKSKEINLSNRKERGFECSHLSKSNSPYPHNKDEELNCFHNNQPQIKTSNCQYNNDQNLSSDGQSQNYYSNEHQSFYSSEMNEDYKQRYNNKQKSYDQYPEIYDKQNNRVSYTLDSSQHRMNKNLILRKSPQRKNIRKSNYY